MIVPDIEIHTIHTYIHTRKVKPGPPPSSYQSAIPMYIPNFHKICQYLMNYRVYEYTYLHAEGGGGKGPGVRDSRFFVNGKKE